MDATQGTFKGQERATYDGAQMVMGGVVALLEQGFAYRDHLMALLIGLLLAYLVMKCMRGAMTLRATRMSPAAAPSGVDSVLATKIDVQVMMENMVQHLESRLQQLVTVSSDGSAATITLSVDTVVDAVGQAINSKLLELKPFEKVTGACSEALKSLNLTETEALKELITLLKTVSSSLEDTKASSQKGADLAGAHTKQLETILQALQAAGQTEQARFGTLDKQLKVKMDGHQEELLGKLSSFEQTFNKAMDTFNKAMAKHDTDHSRLEILTAKLDGVVSKFDKLPEKLTAQGDRTESLLRERTSSLQEDVNKILGTVNAAFREEAGLHRSHKAALDGVQHSLAEMTAALSRPPVDSEGATQSLEVCRNIEGIVTEAYQVIQEIRDRTPDRPPMRAPPSGPQPADQPMQQPQQMPSVIDLSRRIPPPIQGGGIPNLATVTLASGRTVLAPEEEVLGFTHPYPHLQFQRRGSARTGLPQRRTDRRNSAVASLRPNGSFQVPFGGCSKESLLKRAPRLICDDNDDIEDVDDDTGTYDLA
ncbi:hypothetical protein AK812_SmicGene1927 [Symbiodinium microadriaticum]|uniref:Uncharacterized protein n=1 Tax=Symbiodinium microadriaticum TaxID=2951 RepID=A0A1Q9F2L4_SYMMI|nr:hypothetical protein AK812_SmicGene1927 [Symbiodinium microadriaticum]